MCFVTYGENQQMYGGYVSRVQPFFTYYLTENAETLGNKHRIGEEGFFAVLVSYKTILQLVLFFFN